MSTVYHQSKEHVLRLFYKILGKESQNPSYFENHYINTNSVEPVVFSCQFLCLDQSFLDRSHSIYLFVVC